MVMKTKTYEVKVYDFNELSETAKQKARTKYLEDFREAEFFTEDCMEYIKTLFPNSKLEVEYSLNSCQGDGFNIYGKMDIKDAVNFVLNNKNDFDKNDIRFFKWLSGLGYTLYLSENKARYTYCYVEHNDFYETIYDDMIQDGYNRGIEDKEELLKLFDEKLKELIEGLCKQFEDEGYNYFYETEGIDEEIIDMWEANEYEGFTEDGKPVYV